MVQIKASSACLPSCNFHLYAGSLQSSCSAKPAREWHVKPDWPRCLEVRYSFSEARHSELKRILKLDPIEGVCHSLNGTPWQLRSLSMCGTHADCCCCSHRAESTWQCWGLPRWCQGLQVTGKLAAQSILMLGCVPAPGTLAEYTHL